MAGTITVRGTKAALKKRRGGWRGEKKGEKTEENGRGWEKPADGVQQALARARTAWPEKFRAASRVLARSSKRRYGDARATFHSAVITLRATRRRTKRPANGGTGKARAREER